MAITLGSSGITYGDSSSQTTAPTGSSKSYATDKGNLIDLQSFKGSGTWTNPGATKVHVKLIGGGGGSAGYCEGGGAGCYAEGIYDVTGVSTVSVTVGGGGTYTTYYSAAGNGGTTSFGGYLSASGGYGANQNFSHTGGHGGNSPGGSQFAVQGGAGCGHINSVGHGTGTGGGGGYFGGSAAHRRDHTNIAPGHGTSSGAPGAGAPGNITDWSGSTTYRGVGAGEFGGTGMVIIYAYK